VGLREPTDDRRCSSVARVCWHEEVIVRSEQWRRSAGFE